MSEALHKIEAEKKVVCFGCKTPTELGKCQNCGGFNLPARKGFEKHTYFYRNQILIKLLL